MLILGGGPNRIGQGIEFDYCCCHASFALRDAGFETIMMNCNPETVSTDYDTSKCASLPAAARGPPATHASGCRFHCFHHARAPAARQAPHTPPPPHPPPPQPPVL